MKETNRILRYYKKRMYHGRSLAARILDLISLRLILFAACYLWFLSTVRDQAVSVILSITAVLMFSVIMALIHSLRLDRFIEKERKRLVGENLREQLALMPRQEFARLARQAAQALPDYTNPGGKPCYRGEPCLVYAMQQLTPPTLDDMLSVYRAARRKQVSEVLLYTAVPAGADAEAFLRRLSEVSIHPQSPEILVELSRTEQNEMCADELITKKLSDAAAEKKRKRAQPFAKGQTRRYLICAAILLAISFLTRYTLYYRLLAGVSLALAGMSFFVNRSAKQEEVRI